MCHQRTVGEYPHTATSILHLNSFSVGVVDGLGKMSKYVIDLNNKHDYTHISNGL
jgi:hypothetical protein